MNTEGENKIMDLRRAVEQDRKTIRHGLIWGCSILMLTSMRRGAVFPEQLP